MVTRCAPNYGNFYKKIVLWLSENGNVIEKQTIKVCYHKSYLENSVPVHRYRVIYAIFLSPSLSVKPHVPGIM